MSVKPLPAPKPGAKNVALLGTAVAADVLALFLPGANTLQAAVAAVLERRLKEAQESLMEALRDGDVSVLSEPEYDFAVPTTYRFYEAAREGESAKNLKILGGILAGRIKSGQLDTGDFLRISRQLEGLSAADLAALANVIEVDEIHRARDRNAGDSRERQLRARLIPAFFRDIVELGSSLAVLAGRGLIVPDQQTTLDAQIQAYVPAAPCLEIVKRARETDSIGSASNGDA